MGSWHTWFPRDGKQAHDSNIPQGDRNMPKSLHDKKIANYLPVPQRMITFAAPKEWTMVTHYTVVPWNERGIVTIGSEGDTTFTASPNGNCRYQKPGDASWNSATLKVGSINSHRLNVINYGLSFYHLSVSLWRILPVYAVTMPASLPYKLTLCSQR